MYACMHPTRRPAPANRVPHGAAWHACGPVRWLPDATPGAPRRTALMTTCLPACLPYLSAPIPLCGKVGSLCPALACSHSPSSTVWRFPSCMRGSNLLGSGPFPLPLFFHTNTRLVHAWSQPHALNNARRWRGGRGARARPRPRQQAHALGAPRRGPPAAWIRAPVWPPWCHCCSRQGGAQGLHPSPARPPRPSWL
jgi:hypothetical protein